MTVVLVGEVVNSCDTTTGFNQGNISGDDDFVEGTGAIGLKATLTTAEIYTTSLGATAPYNFSTGGTEDNYHIIMWFNTKTPIDSTSGLRIVAGNGTDRGNWYVTPSGFYKGGFVTKVVSTSRDFDVIQAGAWTLAGNPSQLSNITEVGGGFTTTTSIKGNFNNVQLDQMTIGLGLRVSGGTAGSPNTFEEVRTDDEETNFYGWWGSSNGSIVGKGKLYIGDVGGSTVFKDVAPAVVFADELVSEDFYEISIEGSNTTCTLELSNISSADSDKRRWDINTDTGCTLNDTNSVWSGFKNIVLNSNSGLSGTTLIDGTSLTQNGSILNNITVLNANTSGGTSQGSFILSDKPELIRNSTFEFSSGHAIELTSSVSTAFTFTNNTFTNYGVSGSTDAAIYNNSGKAVTINVSGGNTPTIRNGVGASTVVNNVVVFTITGLVDNTEIRIYDTTTQQELYGIENVIGGTTSYTYNYEEDVSVYIMVINKEYIHQRINVTLSNNNTTLPVQQQFDRNYENP